MKKGSSIIILLSGVVFLLFSFSSVATADQQGAVIQLGGKFYVLPIGINKNIPPLPDITPLPEDGTPSARYTINYSSQNGISTDDFYNHYKFEAHKGDIIYFFITPDKQIDNQWLTRCSSGSGYGSPISIQSSEADPIEYGCTPSYKKEITSDGTYIVKMSLNGNSGYFKASLLNDHNKVPNKIIGVGGPPTSPGLISETDNNGINVNGRDNYYVANVIAGDKIYIQAYLDDPLGSHDPSRCASSGSWNDTYSYGVCWAQDGTVEDISKCNCNTNAEIIVSTDGQFVFHMKYLYKNTGYFKVNIVR